MPEDVAIGTTKPVSHALDEDAVRAIERMRVHSPQADPVGLLPEVHPTRIPRHVAIIMDGNGRWAHERGFPRLFGHRNGAATVRRIVEAASDLGIEILTLYSFSLENWKRPPEEVRGLMDLYELYLEGERERLVRENVRFRQIGSRDGLPAPVRDAVVRLEEETASNTGPVLCLAVNYGARSEIVEAARRLADKAARGEIEPGRIDEAIFAEHLHTRGLPDPDLLIRTAGEMRVSNYLLWQISYAELHVSDVYWPEFSEADLYKAIRDYASRDRRFGGLSDTRSKSAEQESE